MEKYIILRLPSASIGEFGYGLKTMQDVPSGDFSIVGAELTKKEFGDLRKDPGVASIAPVMLIKLVEPVTRDLQLPAETNETWGVHAVGAHESLFTGQGVKVAVLDTGIDAGHAAFSGIKIVQKDFTGEGDGDGNGHGTHCAGTIFGKPVDGLRIGVAPGIDQALIGKVLGADGGGSTDAIVKAMEWALDMGANVISMSLGLDFPGYVDRLVTVRGFPVDIATSKGLEAYRANTNLFTSLAALARARSAFSNGTVIIAASGNESRRSQNPEYEIAVSPPAAAEGIFAVGALEKGQDGLRVPGFSNTKVDISAPGVGVRSARSGGGLTVMSGTSMATPHVAGVAALWADKLLRMQDGINQKILAAKLVASGTYDPLAPPFDPLDVGTGIVQAPKT